MKISNVAKAEHEQGRLLQMALLVYRLKRLAFNVGGKSSEDNLNNDMSKENRPSALFFRSTKYLEQIAKAKDYQFVDKQFSFLAKFV